VRLWVPWNEPNQPAFLMPQWRRDKSGLRPESPHVYRWLYQAAYAALKGVSPANQVLLGNTAPSAPNSADDPDHSGVAPLKFLRTMACVDDQLNPLKVPECRRFAPIAADGYAHHPYSRTSPPGASARRASTMQVASRSAALAETLSMALMAQGPHAEIRTCPARWLRPNDHWRLRVTPGKRCPSWVRR